MVEKLIGFILGLFVFFVGFVWFVIQLIYVLFVVVLLSPVFVVVFFLNAINSDNRKDVL